MGGGVGGGGREGGCVWERRTYGLPVVGTAAGIFSSYSANHSSNARQASFLMFNITLTGCQTTPHCFEGVKLSLQRESRDMNAEEEI